MKRTAARHWLCKASLMSLRYLGYLRFMSRTRPPKKIPVRFKGSSSASSSSSSAFTSHSSGGAWRARLQQGTQLGPWAVPLPSTSQSSTSLVGPCNSTSHCLQLTPATRAAHSHCPAPLACSPLPTAGARPCSPFCQALGGEGPLVHTGH